MVRIVPLPVGPLPSSFADGLDGHPLYVLGGDADAIAALAGIGLESLPAPEVIEGVGVLIVPARPMDGLAQICDRLLGPGGCPWDQAQTHESLKKHLIEEAYEVIDAIDAGDSEGMREELGDLLLQPVLHAQMRKLRTGEWDIDEVARGINAKLIRRHPHVFGDVNVADSDEVLRNWDQIKKAEKGGKSSVLAGVPRSLPALLRAMEVSKRAVRAGFEWPDIEGVFEKLREEEAEVRQAIAAGDKDQVAAELGDLLFTIVNIARWAKVDPEDALRTMVDRFTRRFMAMEGLSDRPLTDLSLEEWDDLWNAVKAQEQAGTVTP